MYCQNFFGFDLHSIEIFSCSSCTSFTVSRLTALQTVLYSVNLLSSLVWIQRFQSLFSTNHLVEIVIIWLEVFLMYCYVYHIYDTG